MLPRLGSSIQVISESQNDLAQIIIDSPRNTYDRVPSTSSTVTSTTTATPEGWQIENITLKDYDAVRQLCREAFPLDYPESWFEEVVNGRYIAFGVFHGEILTSLMVAELKRMTDCDPEVRNFFF